MEQKSIIKRTPFHQQAYDLIKGRILSGSLMCGEKINELSLSQELGISRSPIREALRMLERDDLVITSGSTHIVNPMDNDTIENVYSCRICLESYATKIAAKYFTQKDYDKLIGFVNDTKEAHLTGDKKALIYLNTYYHDHIVSLTNNQYLIDMIGRIRDMIILSRIKELEQTDISYAESDHIKIAQALLKHDSELAETLMKEHLANNLKSFLR